MNKLNIEVGSKVMMNYGAMYPIIEGVVEEITVAGQYHVVNANNADDKYLVNEIKEMGTTSVNGSPIGVFLIEEPEVLH